MTRKNSFQPLPGYHWGLMGFLVAFQKCVSVLGLVALEMEKFYLRPGFASSSRQIGKCRPLERQSWQKGRETNACALLCRRFSVTGTLFGLKITRLLSKFRSPTVAFQSTSSLGFCLLLPFWFVTLFFWGLETETQTGELVEELAAKALTISEESQRDSAFRTLYNLIPLRNETVEFFADSSRSILEGLKSRQFILVRGRSSHMCVTPAEVVRKELDGGIEAVLKSEIKDLIEPILNSRKMFFETGLLSSATRLQTQSFCFALSLLSYLLWERELKKLQRETSTNKYHQVWTSKSVRCWNLYSFLS